MQAAHAILRENHPDACDWLFIALANPERKLFVASVFDGLPVPKRLVAAFIRAGVMGRDPSASRMYIEPCVASHGSLAVNERLLDYLRGGTNEEKAGAASALYWAQGNPRKEDLSQLKRIIHATLLREFVENDDLDVRRRIVPLLR